MIGLLRRRAEVARAEARAAMRLDAARSATEALGDDLLDAATPARIVVLGLGVGYAVGVVNPGALSLMRIRLLVTSADTLLQHAMLAASTLFDAPDPPQ